MAKSSFRSFKVSRPIKTITVTKPKPSVPKKVVPQASSTVGKPVAKNATTAKPATEKAVAAVSTETSPKIVEKRFITKEIHTPQYIQSGGSSSFGDMLSHYIMLDWMFGDKHNTPPPPAVQTAPDRQSPHTTASTQDNTSSIVTSDKDDNSSVFSIMTFASVIIIAVLIPMAVYRYFKNRQDENDSNSVPHF